MESLTPKQKNENLNEIRLLKLAQHRHVVTLFEVHCAKAPTERYFLVMELLEGGSLTSMIAQNALKESHMAYIVNQILQALEHFHKKNIVHRDIKSDNIMFSTQGDAKLIDFGLALDRCEEEQIRFGGSAFWMAPEAIRKEPQTQAMDIWSLAITLVEMANKSPPNSDSKLHSMFTTASTGSVVLEDTLAVWSEPMHDFVSKCLVYNPAERATASQLLQHEWLKCACSREEIIDLVARPMYINDSLEALG